MPYSDTVSSGMVGDCIGGVDVGSWLDKELKIGVKLDRCLTDASTRELSAVASAAVSGLQAS